VNDDRTLPVLEDAIVKKAAEFARTKHAHQKRLDGKTPYFTHVEGVARFVAEVFPDPIVVAAAYLHDTIEDTGTTWNKLNDRFGAEVANIVGQLSLDHRIPEEDALRLYRETLSTASERVRIVKLADLLHNLMSLGDAVARARPDFEERVIAKWTDTLSVLHDAHERSKASDEAKQAFTSLYERAADLLASRKRELMKETA